MRVWVWRLMRLLAAVGLLTGGTLEASCAAASPMGHAGVTHQGPDHATHQHAPLRHDPLRHDPLRHDLLQHAPFQHGSDTGHGKAGALACCHVPTLTAQILTRPLETSVPTYGLPVSYWTALPALTGLIIAPAVGPPRNSA